MDQYKSINVETGRHAMELARQEWGNLSLNPAFGALVSDPDRACTVGGEWYVVSIEHQQEDLARSEVAGRGMVPYLPLIPRRERHGRGSQRTVWRPMLGLYMFVKCLPRQWSDITHSRGVRRLLGNNGHPQSIDGRCLDVVRLIESEEAESEQARVVVEESVAKARANGRSGIAWDFAAGDRALIKKGPFAGFYADLTTAVDVHDRIKAFVSLFGRQSLVELSAFEIEKAI